MSKFTLALAFTSACTLMASQAFAADRNRPPKKDLEINVGAGAIYAPAFLGSKDYQLSTEPTGIGYNVFAVMAGVSGH